MSTKASRPDQRWTELIQAGFGIGYLPKIQAAVKSWVQARRAAPVASQAFMWIVSAKKPTISATNARISAGAITHFGDRLPSGGGASQARTPDTWQSKRGARPS